MASSYAIGGKTDHDTVMSSVEQFYPPDNAWRFVEGMQYERYGHSACVLRGKIYVFGGWGDTGFAVLKIECYDPINDLWTTIGEIDHALIGHSIVANLIFAIYIYPFLNFFFCITHYSP